MYHVPCVMCHLSHVNCHLSHDNLKKKCFFSSLKKLDKVMELVGGSSVYRGDLLQRSNSVFFFFFNWPLNLSFENLLKIFFISAWKYNHLNKLLICHDYAVGDNIFFHIMAKTKIFKKFYWNKSYYIKDKTSQGCFTKSLLIKCLFI